MLTLQLHGPLIDSGLLGPNISNAPHPLKLKMMEP